MKIGLHCNDFFFWLGGLGVGEGGGGGGGAYSNSNVTERDIMPGH